MPGPSNKKATTKKKKTASYTKSIPAINSVANPSESPTTGKYTEEYKENICEAAISEFIATEDKIFALTEFFYIAFGLGRLTADAKSVEDAEKEAKSRRNAYEAGKKDGQSRGYAEGFEEGQESGYQDACDQGFLMENAYHTQPPSTSASTQTAPSACVSASVQTDATQAIPRRACIATQTAPIYASTSTQTSHANSIPVSTQTPFAYITTTIQTTPSIGSAATTTPAHTLTPKTTHHASIPTQTVPSSRENVSQHTTTPPHAPKMAAIASDCATPSPTTSTNTPSPNTQQEMHHASTPTQTPSSTRVSKSVQVMPATSCAKPPPSSQTAPPTRENASQHAPTHPPSPKTTPAAPERATSSNPPRVAVPAHPHASRTAPRIPTRPLSPSTNRETRRTPAPAQMTPPLEETPPPLRNASVRVTTHNPTTPAHAHAPKTTTIAPDRATPSPDIPTRVPLPYIQQETRHTSVFTPKPAPVKENASKRAPDCESTVPTPAPDRSTPAPAHSHNVAVQTLQLRTPRPNDVETQANANARPGRARKANVQMRSDTLIETAANEETETKTNEEMYRSEGKTRQELEDDTVHMSPLTSQCTNVSSNMNCAQFPLSTSARFNWAEEASSIPFRPIFPTTYVQRDLSALRSGSRRPFATLQHRTRRSRRQVQPRRVFPISMGPACTRSHPSGIAPGRPVVTRPLYVTNSTPSGFPCLDWDSDPRLSDLSRALQALGWKKPR